MKKAILTYLIIFICQKSYAQFLEGKIYTQSQNKIKTPLTGATIRWQNGKGGEITDPDGFFKIIKKA